MTRETKGAIAADPPALVARTFHLLGAFRAQPVLGVSELSRRTGLPRTTVHRLANQLVAVGALSRVNSRFRLGPTLFELGNLHYPPKIRETLQPFMEDLRELSGADVGLLEKVGSDVIVVQAARLRKSNSVLLKLGERIPANHCVGGRVLNAFHAAKPTTRQTEILNSGYAVDHGNDEAERTAVAVPIRNRQNRVLGSLMISAPTILAGAELDTFIHTVSAFARTFTLAGQTAQVDFLAQARPRSQSTQEP